MASCSEAINESMISESSLDLRTPKRKFRFILRERNLELVRGKFRHRR